MAIATSRPKTTGDTRPNAYVLLLGLGTADWRTLVRNVERGFPYESIEHFRRNSGLSLDQVLEWLQIAPRTLVRRKAQERFSAEESDRLLRAARIFGAVLDLFEGDRAAAIDWLLQAQRALGGTSPIEAARTEVGAREVENLVGRLEHGVYS